MVRIHYPTENENNFSPAEDDKLLEYAALYTQAWPRVAEKLTPRTKNECEKRCRELHPGTNRFSVEENNRLALGFGQKLGDWDSLADFARVPPRARRPVEQIKHQVGVLELDISRQHWSDKETARLVDMHDNTNMTYKDIAEEIPGRSWQSCSTKMKKIYSERDKELQKSSK